MKISYDAFRFACWFRGHIVFCFNGDGTFSNGYAFLEFDGHLLDADTEYPELLQYGVDHFYIDNGGALWVCLRKE